MSHFTDFRLFRCAAIVPLLVCAGCIEQSTVVKVKKDGSGVIHVRKYEQEPVLTIGGSEVRDPDADKSKLPSPEKLKEFAQQMGDGVELVSATEGTNRNGWKGYELVFRFADVNALAIPDDMPSGDDDDAEPSNEDSDSGSDSGSRKNDNGDLVSGYRFAMENGVLKIHNQLDGEADGSKESPAEIGAVDPFAEEPAGPTIDIAAAATEKIMAAALADMRIGLFVEVEGEIESSNALHRKDNLITLVRIDVGKIFKDPSAKQQLRAIERAKKAPDRRRRIQEIADKLDGLEIDIQNPIVVRYR